MLFEELHASKHFDYAAQIEELKYEIAAGEVSDEEYLAGQVEPLSDLPLVTVASQSVLNTGLGDTFTTSAERSRVYDDQSIG